MRLCSNRPEGFGPHSHLHSSLPTTCFLDIIIIPLTTWIYLAAILLLRLLLPLIYLRRSRNHPSTSSPPPHHPSLDHEDKARPARRRNICRSGLRILYYVFIVALLAMISLELARLVDARLGIGLLPFLYAGILLAAGVHAVACRGSERDAMVVKGVNGVYWLSLAVVFAVKVATYVEEGVHSRDGIRPVDRYRVVDEVTDVGVMIFLAVVLVLLEFVAR